MKSFKRLISILLSIAICITSNGITLCAESNVNSNTLKIEGNEEDASCMTEAYIISEYTDMKTDISNTYKLSNSLNRIVVYDDTDNVDTSDFIIPEKVASDFPITLENKGKSISFYPSDTINSNEDTSSNQSYDSIIHEYESIKDGIKESIILSEELSTNSFSYIFSFEDLTPIQVDDKLICLVDVDGNVKGEVTSPCVIDGNGIEDYDSIHLTFDENADDTYVVTVTVDEDYLKEAVYPVTVDPTITWNASNSVSWYENPNAGARAIPSTYFMYAGSDETGYEIDTY